LIGIAAYYARFKTFFNLRFKYNPKYEFLTLGGITLIFILISFAQFKLPHYLNIVMPLFSILTASYLYSLNIFVKDKAIKALLSIQYFILGFAFIAALLLCFYVFEIQSMISYLLFAIAASNYHFLHLKTWTL